MSEHAPASLGVRHDPLPELLELELLVPEPPVEDPLASASESPGVPDEVEEVLDPTAPLPAELDDADIGEERDDVPASIDASVAVDESRLEPHPARGNKDRAMRERRIVPSVTKPVLS